MREIGDTASCTLAKGDCGFLLAFVERDGFGVHGFDGGVDLGEKEGDRIGVGEADEEVDALEGGGNADVVVVLNDLDVRGGVVVFEKDVVGVVDEDLGAVFLDAVVRDAAERVAEVETLAVVGDEEDKDEDEEEDEFLHGVSGYRAGMDRAGLLEIGSAECAK